MKPKFAAPPLQVPRWRLEPMTGGVMPMHLIHSATAQLGHGGGEGNRLVGVVGDILSGGQFCSRGQGLVSGLQTPDT